MGNKGQLAIWEALIIVSLLGYSIFITYKWATKQTETKVFEKGSNANVMEPQAHFGCVNLKVEEYLESKTTNHTTAHNHENHKR